MRRRDQSPVPFTDLGRWWGTDPKTHSQEEIDIAAGAPDGAMLFASCSWEDTETDADALDTLIRRSSLLPSPRRHFWLFSKTGFTENCRRQAAALGNVSLTAFQEMMETCLALP